MPPAPATAPPPELMAAMRCLQTGDNRGALERIEAALPSASDRAPFLALGGLAALRLKAPERAIPLLQQLLTLHPNDKATRANLATAFLETQQSDKALSLVAGAPEASLARIEGYVHQQNGKLHDAIAAYRRATTDDPNDLASWNNLGNALVASGDFEGAIPAFERAISIAPADLPIYMNLADCLRQLDRSEARLKTLLDAKKVAPTDLRLLIELGLAYARVDQLDDAIATLDQAIASAPTFSDAHIELGMIFESLNKVDELSALIAKIDREKAPREFAFLLAWQARREGRFEEAARLAESIPETVHPMRRYHLIGGIADRLGEFDTAFAAFEHMNREALAASPPLNGPSYRTQVESDLAKWTDEWASRWTDVSIQDAYRDPIFLVGFPRSGTTLLDTMLMGSPELSVLEERPMVARTLRLIAEEEDLPTLPANRIEELRKAYFGFAQEFGWNRDRWLVDKHPLNMERVPIIHRLFPNARFILSERHPYDVVLSCFMANFQVNLAMRSFTVLEEAAKTYDAVFSAWHRGLEIVPAQYHALRYERLVVDSESELAPLIDWLGLDWTSTFLDHTETARKRGRVRTASYSQIGEKLYTRASGRWRSYADHLAPILPILKPWAERMGYEVA